MKVRFVSAELAPVAKVGGLADVASSLPNALKALGHDIRIAMPAYPMALMDPRLRAVEKSRTRLQVSGAWSEEVVLYEGHLSGVPVDLIQVGGHFETATSSQSIYQNGCDPYLAFCSAVFSLDSRATWQPDVVHCNDWHTGILPVLIREQGRRAWDRVGTVFTIHNLGYQGEFGLDVLDKLQLPHRLFNYHQLEFFGGVNLLKAGAVFADQVNTVSERYAREIQTPHYGCRLDGLMAHLARRQRLHGILNGIDDREFNPANDPQIAARYNAEDLEGKALCRADLLEYLKLEPVEEAMLIGVVSRLSNQKGLDLIVESADGLADIPCQLVVQGIGDEWLTEALKELEHRRPGYVRFVNAFDLSMAQRIYAGCDAFLMPSAYEPCGLGQMIAMRYGTVPIVRETGGLADTVHEGINGFTFDAYSPDELSRAVRRAHSAFGVPEVWAGIQKKGMGADFSWSRSARKYEELYELALSARQESQARSA